MLGSRARGWQLAAVLALAALLRAGVLWEFGGSLAEDRDNYRQIAQHVAAGDGFLDPDTLKPTAYRPPLYPLLLAGVFRCNGGAMAIGILQLVLGIATVALTVSCGRKLAVASDNVACAEIDRANIDRANVDRANVDRANVDRTSLIAGLLVACDPLLLYQTALVMTETTAAFLASLLLWLSLQRRTATGNFCLGSVFGAACLCRPTFWAFGGLIAALWGFHRLLALSRCAGAGGKPLRRWHFELIIVGFRSAKAALLSRSETRQYAGCIVAGLVLVVAPWVIRNAVVMGRPILTTTHGGYTLLLAHNSAYTQAVVEQPWGSVWEGEPQANWLAEIEAEMAREQPPIDAALLSPTVELARDRWMSRRAWNYIRDEPAIAVRTALTLLGRMWNVVPLETDRSTQSATVRLAIGAFYSGLFLAVLIGVARHRHADWIAWRPVLVLIVGFTAVHSLYWADMRMRTPLVPAVALLAAACFAARGASRK